MRHRPWKAVSAVAIWLAIGLSVACEAGELRGVEREAAYELWRRGVCMLSSVIEPAKRASEIPVDLEGVPAAHGRPLSMSNEITCFGAGEHRIWVATDSTLYGVDPQNGRVSNTYTPADGLPDSPIDALHWDGRFVWLIQRGGVAALDASSGRFLTKDMPRFSHARMVGEGERVCVVADTGTYVYSHGEGSWTASPALPTGREIGRFVAKGVWEGRRRQTLKGLLGEPVAFNGDVYIPSRGSLYRFHGESQKWSEISSDAWKVVPAAGRLYFIGAFGVGEYDPATGETVSYRVGEAIPEGRPQFLVATEANVWVALDSQGLSESYGRGKGGIARFDLKSKKWTPYRKINGENADQVTALERIEGELWCGTQRYTEVATIVAHPGMAHIKRSRPKVEGLSLHRYLPEQDAWETVSMPTPEGTPLMILGQRGTHNRGMMVPRRIGTILPAGEVILCQFQMYPRQYYSGFYPTIGIFAERRNPGRGWAASFANHAAQLDLEGEQPSVLLISGSHGHRIVLAIGHDEILGLFRHGGRKTWAVTQGCVAWFDEAERKWHRVVEPSYRFYWRATAAAADEKNIWIGSDCGLISRINRKTYDSEVLIWLPGRKIERLAFDGEGSLWVRTGQSECRRLPVQMEGVPKGPAAETVLFDGKEWRAAEEVPSGLFAGRSEWTFEGRRNFLLRRTERNPSGERVLFVAEVFRPTFLLEDDTEGCFWISTYCGLVKVPRTGNLRGGV